MVSQPSFGATKQTMDETLRQVGELLLGAIPTIVFVTLLYAAYKMLVHKPLTRVLEERRSRTEGAIEKARADIAAAEARTAIEQDKASAQAGLQQETARLAAEIIRIVLRPGSTRLPAGGGR